jgi:hypothetical protein
MTSGKTESKELVFLETMELWLWYNTMSSSSCNPSLCWQQLETLDKIQNTPEDRKQIKDTGCVCREIKTGRRFWQWDEFLAFLCFAMWGNACCYRVVLH